MTLDAFIEQYGLYIGLLAYVLIKDVIPFLVQKFIPERIKAAEVQRRERVNELFTEREWQHKLETDRLAILNEISKATQSLATQMAQTNANIAVILSGQDRVLNKQDAHNNLMMEAIADMKEAAAKRRITDDV